MEFRVLEDNLVLYSVLILALTTGPTERPVCCWEKYQTLSLCMPSVCRDGPFLSAPCCQRNRANFPADRHTTPPRLCIQVMH